VSTVDDLYAVPPKEFTAARDALAKELRDRGEADQAKRVASLRRPTAALWAANQLARRAPDEVRALLDAAERVRSYQARAVRGGSGDDLRAAMGAQRSALARLEEEAAAALRDASLAASPSTLRAIQSTVQAAAAGAREMRERLRKGRLEHELAPAGFETLLGAAAAPALRQGVAPSPKRVRQAAATHGAAGARGDSAAAKRARRAEEQQRQRDERARRAEARKREQDERRKAREIAAAEAALRKVEERAQAAERTARATREEAEAARTRLERLRS
jgi:hypothetical protein